MSGLRYVVLLALHMEWDKNGATFYQTEWMSFDQQCW